MHKCRICDAQVPAERELCPACGAPVPKTGSTISSELEQLLLTLLAEGQELDAVARYREATSVTLSEAKAAVEQLRKRSLAPTDLDKPFQDELLALMGAGKKIEAVKLYREHKNCQLIEAKEAVEALAAQHGVVSQDGGCATVLVVLLAIAMGSITLLAFGTT